MKQMLIKTQTLKYFISIIFCLLSTTLWAENTSENTSASASEQTSANAITVKKFEKENKAIADSIADSKRRLSVYQGVYLNLDIFNPVATAWRDGRFETSLTIDVDLWHRLFPVAEVGVMTGNIKEELYNYETTGCFAKIGANYNFINFKADRKYDHIFYAGARYAYSYTEYSLKNAVIENKYWEETGTYESGNQKSNFGWFEVVVGVRAQIYKNFFMGVSMQVKTFGHFYEDTPTYPTYISGYGKYGDDVLFGLNYSLSYRF
ncbi:MAG: DUF6048 family protein [Paludibacteraceae bacterium]|nr:DUF6048 family protein [Paludibacteraceae bacterium]